MAAAARALNLSPSAIAQQLQALERELGTRLIVRQGHQLGLRFSQLFLELVQRRR